MRLIDADALNVDIALIAKEKAKSDAQKALMGRLMFVVENYPTIDAEPVRHGRWSEQAIRTTSRGVDEIGYYCLKCGYFESYTAKYCAGCGFKMDLKDGESK